MPHTKTKTVFYFDELDDAAKEKARAWFRDGQLDYDWYESTYDDADNLAALMGIAIDRKPRNNPKAAATPVIYFSGFWSQGDGACFEGRYSFAADGPAKVREYAPQDAELHRIADGLHALGSRVSATVKHRGHYYHQYCTAIDVSVDDESDDEPMPQEQFSKIEKECIELLRDFMAWIYRQLEKECEWLQADEQVDESIRANEYEFDESGRRAT